MRAPPKTQLIFDQWNFPDSIMRGDLISRRYKDFLLLLKKILQFTEAANCGAAFI